jgi:hypothetical protein
MLCGAYSLRFITAYVVGPGLCRPTYLHKLINMFQESNKSYNYLTTNMPNTACLQSKLYREIYLFI